MIANNDVVQKKLAPTSSEAQAALTSICTQLKETIEKHRPIRDRMLLDFSRLSVRIIRNAQPEEKLPAAFDELAAKAENYWCYQVRAETDISLACSYARLYQTTHLVKVFKAEYERECQILSALKKYKDYLELLQSIYSAPGSSQDTLSRMLHLDSTMLNRQTEPLENEGFLSSHQLCGSKYYTLTPAGISLYKKMNRLVASNTSSQDLPTFLFNVDTKWTRKEETQQSMFSQQIKISKELVQFLLRYVSRTTIQQSFTDINMDMENVVGINDTDLAFIKRGNMNKLYSLPIPNQIIY